MKFIFTLTHHDATTKELQIPLLVPGNIMNFKQIKELKDNKVWAFTIGGAVLEKKFAANGSTREQTKAALKSLWLRIVRSDSEFFACPTS